MKKYACVDIGGSSIKVGLVSEASELESLQSFAVPSDFQSLIKLITDWINEVKQTEVLSGLAFSVPGAVDVLTGEVTGVSAIGYLDGHNFKEVFEKETNLIVSVENDANCAALAEVFSGVGKSYKDILFVVCGTGIGGAILKNGKIHTGAHLYGGEFGFMILNNCNGEFETLSECGSTGALVQKVQTHFNDKTYNGVKIFEEANNGNEFCIKAIDDFYENLAMGLFNLQHIYDPELILLGGGISTRPDFIQILDEKIEKIRSRFTIETIKPNIGTCKYKKDANLIGALANFLQN